jgi:glucans biosynthesis protein C
MGSRKHFLDWLRVSAFAGLIVFHVGCLYAAWDFNIKSPRLFPEVDWALLALSPWRMVLLFVIAGVASRCLLAKLGAARFALDRLRRLLPVILFGSLVVIPPQTYIMLIDKGLVQAGFFHFWIFSYLAADQTLVAPLHRTMPTYDHLWFIVYLLLYTLVFTGIAAGLRRVFPSRPAASPTAATSAASAASPRVALWVLLLAPALWLTFANFLIERVLPVTFNVANDLGSHLKWAGMFTAGIAFASRDDVWAWVGRHRHALLGSAVCFLILQCLCRALWLARQTDPATSALCWSIATSLYAWTMTGALCGYALHHLNKKSPLLSQLNEAILPIYVLHQPILLIAAFYIFPLKIPPLLEALLLVGITGLGAMAIYELVIRPFPMMRVLFGLKLLPLQR